MKKGRTHSDNLKALPFWILAIFIGISFAVLALTIAQSPSALIYDEAFHISRAKIFIDDGLYALLAAESESAAGPVYGLLHAIFKSLTNLSAPEIRYINLGLLAGCLVLIALTLKIFGYEKVAIRSGFLLAIPMIWVCSGMALTELPALFLMSLAVTTLAAANDSVVGDQRKVKLAISGYLFAGLCIGLAILTRQTYLPAIILPIFTAFYIQRSKWMAFVSTAVAAAIIMPVFSIWGGLTPPGQEFTGAGIVFSHGILAFGYASALVLLVAPRFLAPSLRLKICVRLVAIAAVFVFSTNLSFLPMRTTIQGLVPEFLINYIIFLSSTAIVTLAGLFVYCGIIHLRQRRQDSLFTINYIFSVIMIATCFGVTHLFSSRYLIMAMPFLLISIQPWFVPNRWALLRFSLGASLGFISLTSYF